MTVILSQRMLATEKTEILLSNLLEILKFYLCNKSFAFWVTQNSSTNAIKKKIKIC